MTLHQLSLNPAEKFKNELCQQRLNISRQTRRSRLPWRGQFSPELVEYLMEVPCAGSSKYYDPFCGSGTVLFEALQRNHRACGIEVNPAAWHLSVLSRFSSLPEIEQSYVLNSLRKMLSRVSGNAQFGSRPIDILSVVRSRDENSFLRLAACSIVILGMGNGTSFDAIALAKGGQIVLDLLSELETRNAKAQCYLGDARKSPLKDACVDGVITSPPYINVFNYHQNYRGAVELIGWKPLQAAPSEIGANRKHRMNRFFTVVQYCIDMEQSLHETARVLKVGSPLVIILGRTSKVLGTSFKNGAIMRQLLEGLSCFENIRQSERVFINRFGESIYEDILVCHRSRYDAVLGDNAREVGYAALKHGLITVSEKNRGYLQEALARYNDIAASPLLNIAIPDSLNGALQ